MNKTIKYVVGGAVGGAIGYFVGSVIVEMILYKAQLAEEAEAGEYYTDADDKSQEEPTNVTTPKKLVVNAPAKKNYTKHFEHEDRPKLAELTKKYQAPIEDRDTTEEENAEMTDKEDEWEVEIEMLEDTDHEPVMVISVDEYASDDAMEHVTLRYYDDDVVTDENNNPIDRPEMLLGDDALVSFGQLSQDEDIVYVRNLPKKCMYEVVRMNKDFSEPVVSRKRAPLSKKENENEEGQS